MTKKIYTDFEAMSRAAADLFAAEARQAVQERGRFVAALAGGTTPRRTYEILALDPLRKLVPWQNIHLFWGDERCVPPDDPRNNAHIAYQAMLDHVPVPPGQVHPMRCDDEPNDPVRRYESLMKEFFGSIPRFDLILLGLGDNGHTASLFPQTPALDERERWVTAVKVAEEGHHRLTLTPTVINNARLIVFLVSGKGKAKVLREVLERNPDPHEVPARLIDPRNGRLLWFIDAEAGELLAESRRPAP